MSTVQNNALNKPVWFITGCSTGFGRELARHTLSLGYPTVVTARNIEQIKDIAVGFEANALLLTLDVTRPEHIAAAVKAAEEKFGRIDVLVNNAGIGYFGSVEESDMGEVRKMFDINVWGPERHDACGIAGAAPPPQRHDRQCFVDRRNRGLSFRGLL